MKLDCKHIWRELSNYLDGEISAELRAEVEAHVALCFAPRCWISNSSGRLGQLRRARLFCVVVDDPKRVSRAASHWTDSVP